MRKSTLILLLIAAGSFAQNWPPLVNFTWFWNPQAGDTVTFAKWDANNDSVRNAVGRTMAEINTNCVHFNQGAANHDSTVKYVLIDTATIDSAYIASLKVGTMSGVETIDTVTISSATIDSATIRVLNVDSIGTFEKDTIVCSIFIDGVYINKTNVLIRKTDAIKTAFLFVSNLDVGTNTASDSTRIHFGNSFPEIDSCYGSGSFSGGYPYIHIAMQGSGGTTNGFMRRTSNYRIWKLYKLDRTNLTGLGVGTTASLVSFPYK